MSSATTYALVPARAGSKGIKNKNMRQLGGKSLVRLAVECALDAGVHPVVSTDIPDLLVLPPHPDLYDIAPIERRRADAQDDSPMLAVVQDALAQVPGEPNDIWVLLQPTQPFRTAAHVQQAIKLLRETPQASAAVSVIELPKPTYAAEFQCRVDWKGRLVPKGDYPYWDCVPACRQDVQRDYTRSYIRDGTVYCFWRKTVGDVFGIYGEHVVPLIIPAAESCELDTEADWQAVEARWRERVHHG